MLYVNGFIIDSVDKRRSVLPKDTQIYDIIYHGNDRDSNPGPLDSRSNTQSSWLYNDEKTIFHKTKCITKYKRMWHEYGLNSKHFNQLSCVLLTLPTGGVVLY